DQIALRAEIAREDERFERDAAEATLLLGGDEQLHLGVAEAVDRLHRVADEEQRPAIAARPAGGQAFDQLDLRARGVLKLVHEQMLDTRIEREQEVRRRIAALQRAQGDQRRLVEIDRALLREYGLELCCHARQ